MRPSDPKHERTQIAHNDEFLRALGMFHAMHSTLDANIDFAISKFLNIPPEQAHLLTAGQMFGKKAKILADLIGRSEHKNKAKALGALNTLRASKRDAIAHSYIWSDETHVKFLERNTSNDFSVKVHPFTLEQFVNHVSDFAKNGQTFFESLGYKEDEFKTFQAAIFNLSRKDKTSPKRPTLRK